MNNPIDRFKNGTLSKEEYEELKEMFNSCSNEKLASLFPIDEGDVTDTETEDMAMNIKKNIDAEILTDGWNRRLSAFKTWAVAASVLALISLGAVAYVLAGIHNPEGESVSFAVSASVPGTAYLQDGSKVIMNDDSRITLAEDFSPNRRSLTFSGEGYFEVKKDPSNPMSIQTQGMDIEVKGTRFNLYAPGDCDFSELSLDNGSVKIKSTKTGETLELKEGESAVLDRISGKLTVSNLGADSSSWQNHELYFRQASPEYVLKRVESIYGIRVQVPQEGNLRETFTGVLPSDNLDEAIAILENLYEVKLAYTK